MKGISPALGSIATICLSMQLAALPATAHTEEYVEISISIRALQRFAYASEIGD